MKSDICQQSGQHYNKNISSTIQTLTVGNGISPFQSR